MVELIAGLGWDPEIRGLLTVVLAFSILGGSVWLLLVTNTGTRLGSLVALAGFWGWLFVMGVFWWIYGIGWVGASPAWHIEDVFADDPGAEFAGIGEAFVGNVDQLPDTNCHDGTDSFPPAGGVGTVSVAATSVTTDAGTKPLCTPREIDLLMAYPRPERDTIIRELLNPQTDESSIDAIANDLFATPIGADPATILAGLDQGQRDQVFDRVVELRYQEIADGITSANDALGSDDPRYLSSTSSPLTLQGRIDVAQNTQSVRVDDITLSSLKGTAPAVIEWAQAQGLLDLAGWNLQSPSQSGEAAATADGYLREELFPDGNFVVLDGFQQGGKDKRTGTGMWDRISHKASSTVQVMHPTNYTVVNVQQSVETEVNPALPPPVPVIDPEAPTYSVVMVRDLGNKRVIPALFTIASLVLFLLTCLVLHWRDIGLRAKGLDS